MASLTSNPQLVAFILSEAAGQRSRVNAVLTQVGAAVKSGTVLAKSDTGTAAFAMDVGATGNPTSGAIVVGAAALPGAYQITFTAATKFDVEAPNGVKIGSGTTGVAFNKNGLTFTLTAGGTPAVAGDTGKITVAAGTNKYVPYTANEAAGPAEAILYSYAPAATGDRKVVVFDCDCEVNRHLLTGLDAAAEASLRKLGIKVVGTPNLPSISTPALT